MNLQIRDIRKRDCDSILEINRASIPAVFELNAGEISFLLELCEYAKVIEVENEVAGYLLAMGKGLVYDGDEYNWFCANLGDDFLYIDQVAIGEKWQGKGCGKKLYTDLENYALRNRRSALVCEVNFRPLNRSSMEFHKRLGFRELSRMQARGVVVSLLVKRDLREDA